MTFITALTSGLDKVHFFAVAVTAHLLAIYAIRSDAFSLLFQSCGINRSLLRLVIWMMQVNMKGHRV